LSKDLEIVLDTWNFVSATISDNYKLMAINGGGSNEEMKKLTISNI